MSKQKVILGLVFLLVAGGVGYYYFSSTPKFALYEIVYAIKTKDRVKFEKRVDVDGIASTLIEDVVSELNKNGNGRAGMFARLIKPRVSQMVHQQIDAAIFDRTEAKPLSEGAAPAIPGDGAGLGSFGRVARGISFKGLGRTFQDGEYMVTPAKFFHEASQKEIMLDLKMKKEGGSWKLVQVGNLVEAFRSVRQGDAASRQVSEAPAPMESLPQAPVGD